MLEGLERFFRTGPMEAGFRQEAQVILSRLWEELGEPSTPGHAVVSLRGGFELGETEVTLGAENLLDRAYRSHLDPPTLLRPGRNFSVRITRSF